MAIKLKYHHHQQRRHRRRRNCCCCCCFPTLIFWLLAIAGIGLWCFTLIIIYAHYLRHLESWWILQQQQRRHGHGQSSTLQDDTPEIRAKMLEIQQSMNRSRMRLDFLPLVLEENAGTLPIRSHFGTRGPLALTLASGGICTGNDSARCVPAFRHLETRWRIAPEYRLVGCLIQKSLSTLLEAVMCLLFDEQRFLASGRKLQNEFSKTRFCRHLNELNGDVAKLRQALANRFGGKLQLEELSFFAIVRDPVERFLSGFVDKCVRQPRTQHFCLGCGTNLTCFVQAEYARMMVEAGRMRMQKSFEDMHFFPQNWRCNFRTMLANYTLLQVASSKGTEAMKSMQNHSSLHQHGFIPPFSDRLMALLANRRPGISERVAQFLRIQMDPNAIDGAGGGMTLHTTSGTKVRQFFTDRLWSSPYLMEFVVRMFWHDFHLFGFPVPDLAFPPD